MRKREYKQIVLRISPELWKELNALAILRDITLNELVEQVLEDYVSKHKEELEVLRALEVKA